MSQFDVAVGMNESTLNQGIAGLYANSQARQQLFKGSQTGSMGSPPLDYTASWDIQAAPTFTLDPPSDDVWKKSINDKGVNPTTPVPTANVFQVVFPQFYGAYTLGTAQQVSGTTEVIVIAQMTIQASSSPQSSSAETITLAPLSVWIDESKMPVWDSYILNHVVLTQVLQKADSILTGMKIPPLSFALSGATVELGPPQGTVGGGWLVLAASLPSNGPVDISGATWPTQPLFVLMSSDVVNQIVNGLASTLNGKQFSDSGTEHGGNWSYTATLEQLSNVQADASDLTRINADALFSFDAQVGAGSSVCALSSAVDSM